jgi:hypothetical protein
MKGMGLGVWRQWHNEELHNLYSVTSIIRMTKLRIINKLISTNAEKWSTCNLLVGEREGKRTLLRPKRIWEDNIKIDLEEVE